jgi:ABC-type transporter Mla subunit MlaD
MSSNAATSSSRERFIFLGSTLLLAVLLLLGIAREQRWGTRWVSLHLLSKTAEGLRSGQEVRISGIAVGTVQRLQLQPDARVKVTLRVQETHADLIGPKSVASLGQEGLVGDHFVAISADPQREQAGAGLAGRTLPYEQPLAINNLIHRLVDTQTELQATLRNTTRLTARDLPATLSSVNKLAGTVERGTAATTPQLQDTLQQLRQTMVQLRQTLQQVSSTGSSAEQTSRQAQQLLQQSQPLLIQTLQDLERVTSSSRRIMQSLQQLLRLSDDAPKRPD